MIQFEPEFFGKATKYVTNLEPLPCEYGVVRSKKQEKQINSLLHNPESLAFVLCKLIGPAMVVGAAAVAGQ